MANFQSTVIVGRLTVDPELSYTPGGTAICKLSIASNRYYKKDDERMEETLFMDVDVWGKSGENCAEYLEKGREVLIEGYLKLDRWESEDGQNRSKIKLVANIVQFLSGGKSSTEEEETTSSKKKSTRKTSKKKAVDEDGIPF